MRMINHVLAAVVIGAFILTMAWPRSAAFAADPAFQVVAGQRQLFVDDVGITKIENLERTMHPPHKKGAVIRPDPMRPQGALQIRSAPLWIPDEGIYRFMVMDSGGPRSTLRSFTSSDGLHWTPGREPKQHNYMVVYDGADPDPARRYKTVVPNQGVAVSPDGMEWSMVPGVAGVATSDEQNLSFDPESRQFILTVKRGDRHGRAVALATSSDFVHWDDYGVVFGADDEDQRLGKQRIRARVANPQMQQPFWNDPARYHVDVYNMGVFRYESIYFGTPAMYHAVGPIPSGANTVGFHRIELTASRDLKHWQRLGNREAFIENSPLGSGAYDLQQMIGPSDAVRRGDELWFYYTSLKYRGEIDLPQQQQNKLDRDVGAISLAVLRRDGFISLDAGDAEGTIETEPFTVPGTKLFVNVDAPKGELRVDVLHGDGKVVAQSEPLTGDLLREPVKWIEGDIAELKGQIASLRFTFRNGQFYSYWLE